MAPDEAERFALEGGVLSCPEDMNRFPPKEFRRWCDRLVESGAAECVVDLSRTRFMASHHLGIISDAWSRALAAGGDLVIRISPELRKLFELSGFDQVFNIVDEGDEGDKGGK